jgi:hypothetical protein
LGICADSEAALAGTEMKQRRDSFRTFTFFTCTRSDRSARVENGVKLLDGREDPGASPGLRGVNVLTVEAAAFNLDLGTFEVVSTLNED